jgi:hypothetical protein
MKKLIATILTLSMIAAVTACGSDAAETTVAETEETVIETSETTEETVAIPDINNNQLFEDMQSGGSFCFIGDSITAGTATDGIPWYQPLTAFITGEIMNVSIPGWTSIHLTEIAAEVPQADYYVIAIGINDVLYIDQPLGAASSEEFIDNLQILNDALTTTSPDASLYYIAPWPFLNFPDEAYETRDIFANAMKDWCGLDEHRYFIDPSETILSVLSEVDTSVYMWNDYHPNAPEGVNLYSYAVLQQASYQ